MVHSRAVRVRLDYGSDGLEVDHPPGPVTVIEPVCRQVDPDPHGAAGSSGTLRPLPQGPQTIPYIAA
jgi:hypothetical protein